jgi:uncharacterized protein (TIGR04255 family)
MAQPRHLSRAPIVEAVIDLRARPAGEVDLQVFTRLAESLGQGYRAAKDINLFEIGWKQSVGKKAERREVDHGRIGCRYDSTDGKQIAQFRKDGFTFSRLAPYTRWEEVFAEASRLYRIFVEACQPEEITRIAVRYINRLPLPEVDVGDFSKYLTAPPPVPKDVPAFLTGFLTRVQIQDPETSIAGRITQTVDRKVGEPGKVNVILDLDFYEAGSKSAAPAAILPRFETLRTVKNRYFFASITETAVELFA